MSTVAASAQREVVAPQKRGQRLTASLRWETRKLRAQRRTKAVMLGVVLLPVAVVVIIHGQSRPPKDTLFGRFAPDNGMALALLILGFASQWVLPLLTAVVAGDIFASEDQHGTWKTVLTRSTSRAELFWAKTLVAGGFAVVVVALLGASVIVTSLVVVGDQPLTGLSGQTIAPVAAIGLAAASWATMLGPVLGFTAMAILLSVWSRNPAVGIAAPVVVAMVMSLAGSLGGIDAVRPLLLTTSFESWHGLLTAPRFTGPLVQGVVVCAGWILAALAPALVLLRRRDITGG